MKCIICGNYLKEEESHNPNPVVDYGRCCLNCKNKYVIPARKKANNKLKLTSKVNNKRK